MLGSYVVEMSAFVYVCIYLFISDYNLEKFVHNKNNISHSFRIRA
jgi:hypothetical protein